MHNDNADKVMNKNNPRKGSFTQTKVCPFAKGYAPGPHASHTYACAFLSPDAIYFSIPNLKIVKGKK
jgi:hypothetical protein